MSRVYQYQTKLTIRLIAGSSMEGVTEALIMYRKPDKTTGQWVGEITDVDTGTVEYYVESEDEIDQTGSWAVWLALTFADGRDLVSEPARMKIYKEGVVI